MEMNRPSYLIEYSGPWVRDSSARFNYVFFEGASADLIEDVKAAQAVNYQYIARRMGAAADSLPRVNYFLFEDKDEKTRKTKVASDAHAIGDYASVYHLPTNATGGQEVGHILTMSAWGNIPNGNGLVLLVEEGFNFYIDEERYWVQEQGKAPFDSLATRALSHPEYGCRFVPDHLAQEGEDNDWSTEQAMVSGAFVRFLIERYGVDRFAELWRRATHHTQTNTEVFTQTYEKPLAALSKAFYDWLGLDAIACGSS